MLCLAPLFCIPTRVYNFGCGCQNNQSSAVGGSDMLLKIVWALGILSHCDALSRQKRIVGGQPALVPEVTGFSFGKAPSRSENVVSLHDDYRTATITGTQEPDGYYAFKGIRYAEPPVGKARFQRPAIKHLNGNINATKYGPPCPQKNVKGNLVGNEDCLLLNVYTPLDRRASTKLPVLVWIHGGGFYSGSAQQYGPAHLIKQNIIVVTIQYRLGSLGWLSSELKELPGNVGFFDMRAAVKWVTENIKFFNGDPNQIVLSGQGVGASAASLLSISSFTEGMISGVLAMSGGPLSASAVDPEPKNTYANMTNLIGCNVDLPLEAVRCLQSKPVEQIINTDSKFQDTKITNEGFLSGLGGLSNAGPAVEGKDDGRFLPFFLLNSPLDSLKTKRLPVIPMLTGVNKLETKSGILGKFRDQVLQTLFRVPDYVDKILPGQLLNTNTGLFKNGNVKDVLKSLFGNNNYLAFVKTTFGNGLTDMLKVMQETTDALFNLPAFLTSHLWSERSDVYFYSFEYKSSIKSPGKLFLPNLLSSSNEDTTNTNNVEDNGEPGHGDELIFLYDVRTLDGKPISGTELKEKRDIEMRNTFTSLVAEFVRNGKPKLKQLEDKWPSFTSSKKSEYVILDEKPRIEQKFRYCQMGLWGGMADVLQSPFCQKTLPGISDVLKTVPGIFNNGVLDNVGEQTITILKTNPIGSLLINDKSSTNGPLGVPSLTILDPKPGQKKTEANNSKPPKVNNTPTQPNILRPPFSIIG